MDKISILRHTIKRFYTQIKKPNICTSKKCLIIQKLEKVYQKYLEALAYNDEIEWQQFFDILDLLNDNIKFLKQKLHE